MMVKLNEIRSMVEWGSAQGNAHLHDDEGGIDS